MVNTNVVAAIAGGLGVCFIGYCVYFDKKRRSDPDFKRKLYEKRRKQRENQANQEADKYPDLNDEKAVLQFLSTELHLGEQFLSMGDIENGTEHLANAVAVAPQKENFLNLLRTTLPGEIFQLIIQKLPVVSEKIYNSTKQRSATKFGTSGSNEPKIVDITEASLTIDECLD